VTDGDAASYTVTSYLRWIDGGTDGWMEPGSDVEWVFVAVAPPLQPLHTLQP